ncbi:MAG: gluconate 2-dehydrogenase [Hyphomicrobiales bacterium]|nr:gluconate 2-dehydrogenase [Hyphomicrobiales bacterium]
MRRIWIGLAAVCVIVGLAALAVFSGLTDRSVVNRTVDQPLSSEQMKALAPKGRYLAVAADCVACHTDKGGPAWGGGMAFATPMGTIYATNISPDKETGIGQYSRAEFHRAVRDGIGKHGYLYPAMPYTSYRLMAPDDVDAIYAYLITREPIPLANKPTTIPFPMNIRRFMTFWDMVNLSGEAALPGEQNRSAAWNRGNYLVNALGHCGECHTPRNLMMAMKPSQQFKGAVLEGIEAPDITPPALKALGFDYPSLAQFMKTGIGAQGAMTHQMFDVVHHSTQHLTDEDLTAMATYLLGDDAGPAKMPVTDGKSRGPEAGRRVYVEVCSGCHGSDGEGIPNVSVPMRTNTTLRLASPRNFLQAVLHGLPEQEFPGERRMQPMPGFANKLTDQQITDLTNWMRATWGGQATDVTSDVVAKAR